MPNEYLDKVELNNTTYDIKDTISGYISGVTVDGTSVVSSGVANLATSTSHPYNASTNKLATMGDIASAGGGTVTGVTAGAGLTTGNAGTSGGTISSSGTIRHSNSVTAQTTQGVYPITIDSEGHVASYGSAVPELFLVTATITTLSGGVPTGGITDKTSAEIYAAATAGKLVVLKIPFGVTMLVAPLALTEADGNTSYARFVYEDQANPTFQYATLQVIGSSFTISLKPPYIEDEGVSLGTTSPVALNGTAGTTAVLQNTGSYTLSLASGYGDTQNPYAAKAPHYVLAGPSSGSSNAAPSFRALVTGDIPTTDTYSSSGTDPVNGKAINAALQTLDSSISQTSGKAISAITITDGKIASSSTISVGDANQNAFSKVKVGNTEIEADSTTDTVELVAGTGISLTPDATNDKVTIASTVTSDVTDVQVNGTSVVSNKVANITSIPLATITNADDLKAIEGLSGTSGILVKNAANTWDLLSTDTYIPWDSYYNKNVVDIGLDIDASHTMEIHTLYKDDGLTHGQFVDLSDEKYLYAINGHLYDDMEQTTATEFPTNLAYFFGFWQPYDWSVINLLPIMAGMADSITFYKLCAIVLDDTSSTSPVQWTIDSLIFKDANGSTATWSNDTTVAFTAGTGYVMNDSCQITVSSPLSLGSSTGEIANNGTINISLSSLGNISNAGAISSTAITPANGDYILLSDTSNSSKIERGIAIGNDTTKYLRNDGTWQTVSTDDTKVTNTLSTTTKYYLTGTTSNTTNTGTQTFDSGIYSTTTAGQLNATTYKVNEQVTLQWNSTDSSLDFIFA